MITAGVLVAPLGTARHSGGTSRTGAKRLTCTSSRVSLHPTGIWVRRRASHATRHRLRHSESSLNLDFCQPIFIVTMIPIIVTMRVDTPTIRAQQEALSALLLLS